MTRSSLVAMTVVLAACAQPVAAPEGGLDADLGVPPVVTAVEPAPLASPAAPVVGPSSAASSSPADPAAAASPAATPTPAVTTAPSPSPSATPVAADTPSGGDEPLVLLAVGDAAGDHGPRGPDWADLRVVELVELGNDLRVTLRFSGPLPPAPPAGEVPLVGVDIGDEGYQLFVEGGGEAWNAYLDTPGGFVPFPGTFELAGRAMVLQVPFNAVGSPTRAPVRVFAEWSRDSGVIGALNPSSEDRLDGEPHTFDRAP